jgi:DNA-binding transcriptional MerR regulator
LKKSGLSIKQIKDLIGMVVEEDAMFSARLALFQGQRDALEQQLEELRVVQAVLEFKVWYYE